MNDFLKKNIDVPVLQKAQNAIGNFTAGEKMIFWILTIIMIFSGILITSKVSDSFTETVPGKGGEIVEGVIGSPRFINPILAISDADRDISSLVFSGLVRTSLDGKFLPDLAEKYEISDDGLTYTFHLRKNIKFHDGTNITADDFLFTVSKMKDPEIKSPKRAEWEGVDVEKTDDSTIVMKLKRPFSSLLENSTVGIIPKHIWKDFNAEEFTFSGENISPVGSGPYQVDQIEKTKNGIPTKYYLVSFKKYLPASAYVKKMTIRLYPGEKELITGFENGEIDSMGGISSNEAKLLSEKGYRLERMKMPRVFGVFFNQNHSPLFADLEIRKSLEMTAPKDEIINSVLFGYADKLDGPLPNSTLGENLELRSQDKALSSTTDEKIVNAQKILEKAGWSKNKDTGIYEKAIVVKGKKTKDIKSFVFSLSVPNTEEMKAVANILKNNWEKLGAKIDLKIFEQSDLKQNVIKPRKYDALLFGEVIGKNPDLYAFWHSQQRFDPGYNISLYTNSKVDKLLDQSRMSKNQEEQRSINRKISDEITKDYPAVFLYSPDYIYVLPKKLQGFDPNIIADPSERLSSILNWHLVTEKVWKFFLKEKIN
jgi:peptide/nickel transport system substrate-binding protein